MEKINNYPTPNCNTCPIYEKEMHDCYYSENDRIFMCPFIKENDNHIPHID